MTIAPFAGRGGTEGLRCARETREGLPSSPRARTHDTRRAVGCEEGPRASKGASSLRSVRPAQRSARRALIFRDGVRRVRCGWLVADVALFS
jgi:hypothetical protein